MTIATPAADDTPTGPIPLHEPIPGAPSVPAYIRRLKAATPADSPYVDEDYADEIGEEFALLARTAGGWLERASLILPGGYREALDVLRFFGVMAPAPRSPEAIDDEVETFARALAVLPSAEEAPVRSAEPDEGPVAA